MDVKERSSDGDVRIYHQFKNAVFQLSRPPFFQFLKEIVI